jgi:hypothetical protein
VSDSHASYQEVSHASAPIASGETLTLLNAAPAIEAAASVIDGETSPSAARVTAGSVP